MTEFRFEIPGEPRGKMRPRATSFAGHARVYPPSKQVEYENWVRLCYQNAHGPRFQDGTPIECVIRVVHKIPKSWSKKKVNDNIGGYAMRKPDVDNLAKSVLDALNGGIAYADDSQVARLYVTRIWGLKDCVYVTFKGDINVQEEK